MSQAVGRPSGYCAEIAAQICELIEDGCTISEIERRPGLPSWPTIRRWLKSHAEFHTQYARAYEVSAHALECEALDAMRQAKDAESAAVARAKLDTIKWAAGKRNPKVYGEKLQHDVSGEIAHTVSAMPLPERANRAAALLSRAKVIDGEPPEETS